MVAETTGAFPADIPASSFRELQSRLLAGQLILGVARDHAKDWWTLGVESKGRRFAALFLYFPILVGIAVVVGAVVTGHYTWLVALPFGLVAMFLGSPMNPGRLIALVLGIGLLLGGLLGGLSSLVVSGIVVLVMYVEMQVYYGLGYRAFQRFLVTDATGFVKYWNSGIVMLQDPYAGQTFHHDPLESPAEPSFRLPVERP